MQQKPRIVAHIYVYKITSSFSLAVCGILQSFARPRCGYRRRSSWHPHAYAGSNRWRRALAGAAILCCTGSIRCRLFEFEFATYGSLVGIGRFCFYFVQLGKGLLLNRSCSIHDHRSHGKIYWTLLLLVVRSVRWRYFSIRWCCIHVHRSHGKIHYHRLFIHAIFELNGR